MEVAARLAEIDDALATLPAGSRRAAAGPALAELCLRALDLDEDAVASVTRRALLLAAAAGAVLDAPSPGGRPVLEAAAELADAGLATPLGEALDRLGSIAEDVATPRAAAAARGLAGCRDEALEALAVVLLTAAVAE